MDKKNDLIDTPNIKIYYRDRSSRTTGLDLSKPKDFDKKTLDRINEENKEIRFMKAKVRDQEIGNTKKESEIVENMENMIRSKEEELKRIVHNNDMTAKQKDEHIDQLVKNIQDIQEESRSKVSRMNQILNEQRIELEEKESWTRGTNWDAGNINTVTDWIKECNKEAYIYEYVLEDTSNVYRRYTRAILILTSIQALFTISNLGIEEKTYPDIAFAFKIVLAILATAAAILTQITKEENFETIVGEYNKYIERINNFITTLGSVMRMKIKLRSDGDRFVTDNSERYDDICANPPNIKLSRWKQADSDYKKYLANIKSDPESDTRAGRKRKNFKQYAKIENNNAQYISPLTEDRNSVDSLV